MKKTIGILGGMGPLATADLLIKITTATDAACDNEHIRVYIDSDAAIPDRTGAILHGGPDPVPEMLSALRNLEKCGADCVIMACNTAHYFLPRLRAETQTPILDMLEITAGRCAALYPGKRAAILGTDRHLILIFAGALGSGGVKVIRRDGVTEYSFEKKLLFSNLRIVTGDGTEYILTNTQGGLKELFEWAMSQPVPV